MNKRLNKYVLTTVGCTHYFTHSGIMANMHMYNNNVCDPHKCQEVCLLCHATPGNVQALLPCVMHSVLPNHYRITKEPEPMSRLPLAAH